MARDGIVLLKNVNNALPLKRPASLAIIGSDAIVNPSGPNACTDRKCNTGTLAMVGEDGALPPTAILVVIHWPHPLMRYVTYRAGALEPQNFP